MYGHTVYLDAAGPINNITFPIEAPPYSLTRSASMVDGDLEPLFRSDRNATVLTRATIADMISMNDSVIPFKILGKEDIVTVYKYLDAYLNDMVPYLDHPEVSQYITKANYFKNKLMKSMHILAKSDPSVSELIGGGSIHSVLKSLSNEVS